MESTNPFQHPYLLTALSLEAHATFFQKTAQTEQTHKQSKLFIAQFKALTLSSGPFAKKFNYKAHMIWPTSLVAVLLAPQVPQEPKRAHFEYLFCDAEAYVPQFVMIRSSSFQTVPTFAFWDPAGTKTLRFTLHFPLAKIIPLSEVE